MKYFPLVWRSLWRRRIRTIFTLLSIFVAFLLFGVLMTIRAAFTVGVDLAGVDRLVLMHKVSLIIPLPVSYQARLQSVPGVETATHNTWFGGTYQTAHEPRASVSYRFTGTRITWQWTTHPRSAVIATALPLLAKMWTGYARQALERIEELLVPA